MCHLDSFIYDLRFESINTYDAFTRIDMPIRYPNNNGCDSIWTCVPVLHHKLNFQTPEFRRLGGFLYDMLNTFFKFYETDSKLNFELIHFFTNDI